jgi:exopolysaccharide biosynthesis polyprenyl glycosylphosphotransferase
MSTASEVLGYVEEAGLVAAEASGTRGWFTSLRRVLTVTDAVIVTAAMASICLLTGPATVAGLPLWCVGALTVLAWLGLLTLSGSRRAHLLDNGSDEFARVIRASAYTLLGVFAVATLIGDPRSCIPLALAILVGTPSLLAGRYLARRRVWRARDNGAALSPAVVVGTRAGVRDVVAELRRSPRAGYLPTAACVVPTGADSDPLPRIDDLQLLPLEHLSGLAMDGSVSTVMVVDGLSRAATRELCWNLEGAPVELLLVPHLTDVDRPRISARATSGLCFLRVELPRYEGVSLAVKRMFDVMFSATVLVVAAPLFALIATLIKLDDGGAVFFRQERVGCAGEPFVILKFRTMCAEAEALKRDLTGSVADGPLFKLGDDPRITRVGRFLRKTSLDELPQFWTVLKGDMSVVGPRPHLAHELERYPRHGLRRLLIRPGITGLWQVSGRSDLSIDESVRLDLKYVENRSLTTDIAIILRTVATVLRPRGAY